MPVKRLRKVTVSVEDLAFAFASVLACSGVDVSPAFGDFMLELLGDDMLDDKSLMTEMRRMDREVFSSVKAD